MLGALSTLALLAGGLRYIVSSELQRALEQPKQDITEIRDKDLGGLRKDFEYLRKDVDDIRFRMASDVFQPGAASSPKRIADARDTLLRRAIAIPRNLVSDAGTELLREASQGPVQMRNVWPSVTSVMRYISFIDAKADPSFDFGKKSAPPFSMFTGPSQGMAYFKD